MPVLKNAKYEIFAQERAKGASASDAYERAGYTRHDGNAHRLSVNEKVTARVDEILSKSAERTGVTVDRIVSELAKIGFADIRKVMRWGESVALPIGENGEVFVSHDVALVSSDDLDDATAAAVSEVRKTKEGLSIKMHDKRAALVDLGKHLGMFTEKREISGSNGAPILIVTGVPRRGDEVAALRAAKRAKSNNDD